VVLLMHAFDFSVEIEFAMRLMFALLAVLSVVASAGNTHAAFILRNTGVDGSGVVLTHGSTDSHYKFASLTGGLSLVNEQAVVASSMNSTASAIAWTSSGGFPVGPWLGDNTTSTWIAPNAPVAGSGDTAAANTYFAYTTTFDLTGFVPSSVVIAGRWSTDNTGPAIYLNGIKVTGQSISSPTDYNKWSNFGFDDLTSGTNFLSGLNQLTFVVYNTATNSSNTGNPTGLRVEFDPQLSKVTPVPAPAALGLFALGLPVFGLLRRRMSR